jgi:hypothetical protein
MEEALSTAEPTVEGQSIPAAGLSIYPAYQVVGKIGSTFTKISQSLTDEFSVLDLEERIS